MATPFDQMLDAAGAAAASYAGDYATQIATGIVSRVKIETEWLPVIDIDVRSTVQPGQPGRFNLGDELAKRLKPRVTLETRFGPQVIEPFGPPAVPTKWPWLMWGLIVVGGLASITLVRGVLK